MRGLLFGVAAGAAVLQVADASCPNACSGHGVCGEFDACTCYPDWGGGDCSQRYCPSSWAWVTTNANGDLDGDGNRNGLTVYDADHYFTASGIDYVVSQNEPQGHWETWPGYVNQDGVDEGHFYMECSNMGICDRTTGMCQCFDGYHGSGCRRTSCPNDCSGHGVCKTVSQTKPSGVEYILWDKDMSRFCECDGGYSGADCSERKCGYGDDPLTTGQTNEIQWVDIYADMDNTGTPHADNVDWTFSGYIRLTYTDYNGVAWETDDIAIEPYGSAASDMAANVAAALNNLPNDVLSGVTVSQGYVEHVIPGNVATDGSGQLTAAASAGHSLDLTDVLVRCADHEVFVSTDATGSTLTDHVTGAAAFTAVTTDPLTCYEVEHLWSVRFEISFPNTPGSLQALSVDISKVTDSNGFTNAQRGDTKFQASVASNRQLASHAGTGGIEMGYTHPSQVTDSCTIAGGTCEITSATKTVVVTDTSTLFPHARIKITCASKVYGTFTVNSITDGTTFVLTEDIGDCLAADVSGNLLWELQSHVVTSNADLTGLLSAGDRVEVQGFNSVLPKLSAVYWDADNGVGHLFLDEEYLGNDANDGETTTTAGDTVLQYGVGTSEKEECSSRGLCDRETGICQCFKGYTGWACGIQNALSL